MTDKKKPVKKTVVVTKQDPKGKKEKLKPTASRSRSKTSSKSGTRSGASRYPMLFDSSNYKWILIGLGVIALGMLLMLGGSMPSPDVWDESLIYSFRRTVIAPLLIIVGFGIEVYAIFKNY